jgi:putative molybdopterin biosynthesis protein
LADAGVGIEAAALEFGLHFVPLVEENYFLACLKGDFAHAAVRRLCSALASARWRTMLAELPGYQPALAPGNELVLTKALPWWRDARTKAGRANL